MKQQAAAVLRGAIDELAGHGWWHNDEARDGRLCAVLAIEAAADRIVGRGIHLDVFYVRVAAFNALRRQIGLPETVHSLTSAIWAWNDAPERTYEDVVLAIKQAAHELEAQAS